MRFRYTISHVPGKDLIIADALSRATSRNIEKSESDFENGTTAFVDMIMESFPASNNRLEEIRREQASDPIIQELSPLCREGWTKKSKKLIYFHIGRCVQNSRFMVDFCLNVQV